MRKISIYFGMKLCKASYQSRNMKKTAILILVLMMGSGFYHRTFGHTDIYTTSGGEIIFSFASIEQGGNETGSILRFAPVLNLQSFVNFDVTDKAGFFSGIFLTDHCADSVLHTVKTPGSLSFRYRYIYFVDVESIAALGLSFLAVPSFLASSKVLFNP